MYIRVINTAVLMCACVCAVFRCRCTLCEGKTGHPKHTRRKCERLTKHAPEKATFEQVIALDKLDIDRLELVGNFDATVLVPVVPQEYVKGLVVKKFFRIVHQGQHQMVCGIFGLDSEGKEMPPPVAPLSEPVLTFVDLASVIAYFTAQGLEGKQSRKVLLLSFH